MTLVGDQARFEMFVDDGHSSDVSFDIQTDVTKLLIDVILELFPETQVREVVRNIAVRLMGSRMYKLASLTSDADFAVALPDWMCGRERDIQLLLGHFLVKKDLVHKDSKYPKHEQCNFTLKWKHHNGVDTSLLVTTDAGVARARLASEIISRCLEEHGSWRSAINIVLQDLRCSGNLNIHGQSVGQRLKTVSGALLCISILAHSEAAHSNDVDEAVLVRCLYTGLATFDASTQYIEFHMHREGSSGAAATEFGASSRMMLADGVFVQKLVRRNFAAALVLQLETGNSANKLTHPALAQLQWHCAQKAGLDESTTTGILPLSQQSKFTYFDLALQHGTVCHYRFYVRQRDWWCLPGDCFAVVTLRAQGHGKGLLLILTTDANDVIEKDIASYATVVTFTWSLNHESNPVWITRLLVDIDASKDTNDPVDVLACSRGVQAFLCAFDLKWGMPRQLATFYREVVLAGGCLWQRQDQELASRVDQGLREACKVRGRPLVTMQVASLADNQTIKQGNYSKGNKNHRFDYTDVVDTLKAYTQPGTSTLVLASHTETCAYGFTALTVCAEEKRCVTAVELCPALQKLQAACEIQLTAGINSVEPSFSSPPSKERWSYVFRNGDKRLQEWQQQFPSNPSLARQLKHALRSSYVCLVNGDPGSGKSTQTPSALYEAFPDTWGRGTALVLQKKLAATTLLNSKELRGWACQWNGDCWVFPRKAPFVMLVTPVSLFHRLCSAEAWDDIAWLILDEFHNKDVMILFYVAYFVSLKKKKDSRVTNIRLLLMSATQSGPIIKLVKDFLTQQAISLPTATVESLRETPQFVALADVVELPYNYKDQNDYQRAVTAAILMVNWIMTEWHESAVILFIVAGEPEVQRMIHALKFSDALMAQKFKWQTMPLTGDTAAHRNKVLRKMKEQDCCYNWPALFIVAKAGSAEDSWTPNANGLIDLDAEVELDAHGFLHIIKPASDSSYKQRRGRICRYRRGVWHNVSEPDRGKKRENAEGWEMTYPDRLKVTFCALHVQYTGVIPGLTCDDQGRAQTDLVELGCAASDRSGILRTTTFGAKVAQGDLDVQASVLRRVGAALKVEEHATIALAYLKTESTGLELFTNLVPESRGAGPLMPSQHRMAVGNSDVLTAIDVFLRWMTDRLLPSEVPLIKENCLKAMDWILYEWKCHYDYAQLCDVIDWHSGVRMALAFTYRRNIVYDTGGTALSPLLENDSARVKLSPPLALKNMRVHISRRSVCAVEYMSDASKPRWVVYASSVRERTVKGVTELTPDYAAWFGALPHLVVPLKKLPVSAALASVVARASGSVDESFMRLARPGLFSHGALGTPAQVRSHSRAADAAGQSDDDGSDDDDADDKARKAMEAAGRQRERIALLLKDVREHLNVFDTSSSSDDVAHVLMQVARDKPELASAASTLRLELLETEVPSLSKDNIRAARHNMQTLLTVLLADANIPCKRRKIKAYCYVESATALRIVDKMSASRTTMHPLLTDTEQARLLEDALGYMSSMEREDIRRSVADNVATVGVGQKASKDAKQALDRARETVDWQTGRVTCSTRDALEEMLSKQGYKGSRLASVANNKWENMYYTRNLYSFDGTTATKADIFSSWVKSGGYTQAQCEEHFRQLKLEVLKHLKPLDPEWAAEERQRLVDKFKSRRSNAD